MFWELLHLTLKHETQFYEDGHKSPKHNHNPCPFPFSQSHPTSWGFRHFLLRYHWNERLCICWGVYFKMIYSPVFYPQKVPLLCPHPASGCSVKVWGAKVPAAVAPGLGAPGVASRVAFPPCSGGETQCKVVTQATDVFWLVNKRGCDVDLAVYIKKHCRLWEQAHTSSKGCLNLWGQPYV